MSIDREIVNILFYSCLGLSVFFILETPLTNVLIDRESINRVNVKVMSVMKPIFIGAAFVGVVITGLIRFGVLNGNEILLLDETEKLYYNQLIEIQNDLDHFFLANSNLESDESVSTLKILVSSVCLYRVLYSAHSLNRTGSKDDSSEWKRQLDKYYREFKNELAAL